MLALLLSCPYVGAPEVSPLNGLYDLLCTLILFPLMVWIGACGRTTDRFSGGVCEFLGRLSYPVYIIHYPVMYLFYAWVWNNGISFHEALPVCGMLLAGIILIAWAAMRFYDEPVRKALSRRFLGGK